MLAQAEAFSGFAVPDLAQAEDFYGRTLGIETELLAERGSRVDDLGLLVDLIDSGWRAVDERLHRIEEALQQPRGATVYRIGEAS